MLAQHWVSLLLLTERLSPDSSPHGVIPFEAILQEKALLWLDQHCHKGTRRLGKARKDWRPFASFVIPFSPHLFRFLTSFQTISPQENETYLNAPQSPQYEHVWPLFLKFSDRNDLSLSFPLLRALVAQFHHLTPSILCYWTLENGISKI